MPSNQVTVYLPDEAYERWERRRGELGYDKRSQFIQAMVEAGLKKFDAATLPDDNSVEIRRQRDEWREKAREREAWVGKLEDRLSRTEQETVREYVAEHPDDGVTVEEIVQHLIDTVYDRANDHVNSLLGDAIRYDSERDVYLPADDGTPSSPPASSSGGE